MSSSLARQRMRIWESQGRSMGQRIGESNPFLAKTACMDPESRELIAYLEALKTMIFLEVKYGELDKATAEEIINEINVFLEPIVTVIGRARWEREDFTDLGLMLSLEKKHQVSLKGDE